ncbi:hypothetical protein [Halalkalibacillus halophilus]|uniref:hypothetical protein n=1 Tax=Halalkalibacillus halophilus TaxID=392827 RepID=UPI0004147498|nr:hypothetical protein [Halalkalibacillus halophilus]
MRSVKMLKPYYVKKDDRFVRVILAFQYFSIIMEDKVYHFIPLESREIILDRTNRQIVNQHDLFVFQKGVSYIKVPLKELMKFNSFEEQLNEITDEFFGEEKSNVTKVELDLVMTELEQVNYDRLIDLALKNGDRDQFIALTSKQ